MTFSSILFAPATGPAPPETDEAPPFFADLRLDQIVDTITAGRHEYGLAPFFYRGLDTVDAVTYRQEVLRDLEKPPLRQSIELFARKMQAMRQHLAQADKMYYGYQQQAWFVDAVQIYCDAVEGLQLDLAELDFGARGLTAWRNYLTDYAHSQAFTDLRTQTQRVKTALSTVRYGLRIRGMRVDVFRFPPDEDLSLEVASTFAKFRPPDAPQPEPPQLVVTPQMNPVEARILDNIAQLYPDIFDGLEAYRVAQRDYLDRVIGRFDREVQFYLAVSDYVALFKQAGLPFCYPQLSLAGHETSIVGGFDAALGYRQLNGHARMVSNDVHLSDPERVLVVSGPNQGGKTTFARMFGQIHYLASLGCPVPGRAARLRLVDRVFTHFEREETIESLHGKLQDDLIRIRQILTQATSHSLVIMNEIFSSTTLGDAVFLSERIMHRIIEREALCVWVSFIDELASYGPETVSLVATVLAGDPSRRTYQIVRRPADGLSYALSLAEKHRVSYGWLKERLP